MKYVVVIIMYIICNIIPVYKFAYYHILQLNIGHKNIPLKFLSLTSLDMDVFNLTFEIDNQLNIQSPPEWNIPKSLDFLEFQKLTKVTK